MVLRQWMDATFNQASLWLLLLAYVLVWTAGLSVANTNLGPSGDMLENFVWGQTFAWGQLKHPPLVGWVTGFWFEVMPQTLWSYHLLSYLNTSLGLAGVYVIAHQLNLARIARSTVLLMMLALPYSTLAQKFNANTILLAIWPWVVVSWLGCMQETSWRSWFYAFLLGLTAALGFLAKYYTGVLVLSIMVVTFLSQEGRSWLRKPQPWIAMLVLVGLLTPHILWLRDHDFVTFDYIQAQGTGGTNYVHVLKFALAPLAYWILAFLGLLVVVPKFTFSNFYRAWLPREKRDALFWLILLPYLFTLLFGLSGFVNLSSPWSIPLGYALTVYWLRNLSDTSQEEEINQRSQNLTLYALCLVLLASPLDAWYQGYSGEKNYYLPSQEAVFRVETLWFDNFKQDYQWVAGDQSIAASIPFYSGSDASVLTAIPQRPKSSGIVICHVGRSLNTEESFCVRQAERWKQNRHQQVLTMEFTVAKQGLRYSMDQPHLYRAYFYDHDFY